jgi:hypothetical protein
MAMKHIFLLVGTWASVVVVAGICLAANPAKPVNQPAATPSNSANYNRAAAAARRAAQTQAAAAAAQQAAARNAAATATRQNRPYGYGYSTYSPYGYYSPYRYVPPWATPYVLGYNSWTGTPYLYPYTGGGYSSYYPEYGYQYAYPNYGTYLGYGYPGAVFAPADQLFGPGPVLQLMGVGQ